MSLLPQPVPPSWKDLGKSSNDLLSKDFITSGASLEVKTATPSGVSFRVTGKNDKGTTQQDVEVKYTDRLHGLAITQNINTGSVLRTTVEAENHLAKGLKFDLGVSLPADFSNKNALLTTTYKQPGVHTRTVLDMFKGPSLTADVVLGRDGFLIGAEGGYNVTEGKVTTLSAAVGYSAPQYALTAHAANNWEKFSASYYHRVNPDVEAGAKVTYSTAAKKTNIELGGKAYLDQAAFVKAKIDSVGTLSLGYTQVLRPGVKLGLGLALDTKKLNEVAPAGPVHKVGASLTFEA